MNREYLIKRVNNRIDLNDIAICECTAEGLKLVVNNNSELLQLIKTELEKQPDKTYEQGMRDIWELIRKIICEDGYNTYNNRKKIFGYEYIDELLERLSPEDALDKLKEYEERKRAEAEKPVIGDVVEAVCSCNDIVRYKGIYISERVTGHIILTEGQGVMELNGGKRFWKFTKTGKRFDNIQEILDAIKEE